MPSDRFAVGLTSLPTAARVARQRARLRSRMVSTVLSLLLMAAFLWWFRPDWETRTSVLVGTIWGISTVLRLLVSAIGLYGAKRDLARISQRPVFFVDPYGLEFVWPVPAEVRWEDVETLRIEGRHLGAGPKLVLRSGGRRTAKVPLSFLDASASVIDLAVRANSMGRIRLDAAGLDALV